MFLYDFQLKIINFFKESKRKSGSERKSEGELANEQLSESKSILLEDTH